MTCSIDSASPSSPTSTTHRVDPDVALGGVEADRHLGAKRLERLLARGLRSRPSRDPVIPTSRDVRGAAGQHARVGGRDVGVGAEAGGDAAVEVPAHRDLLARQLAVEVDDHRVGPLLGELREPRVGLGERRARDAAGSSAPLRLRTPTRRSRRPRRRCGPRPGSRAGSSRAGSRGRCSSRNP